MLTDDPRPQFQHLADKYAPATPEITETLAKLQLPPHTSVDRTSPVPLLRRGLAQSQHEVAVVIRDGRRLASQLASLGENSKTTDSTGDSRSQPSNGNPSSMSTALEQDFTIEGKRGNLQCPFSQPPPSDGGSGVPDDGDEATGQGHPPDVTPHHSADPICAAMYEESTSHTHGTSAANGGTGSKCPIRYMDQHSAEEIAHYVETHKHELPRSHEVCLRRYQSNEDQMRKLDSKYGNLVSMVEGLGQLHQSMLPEAERGHGHPGADARGSNDRVQSWAKEVTSTTGAHVEEDENPVEPDDDEAARQSHFDRPLKEVRVGESPSRPWGISVPVYEPVGPENEHPSSPPPAPVRMMPTPAHGEPAPAKTGGKCPFDHTKLQALMGGSSMGPPPMDHPGVGPESTPKHDESEAPPPVTPQPADHDSFSPTRHGPIPGSPHLSQPAFISPESVGAAGAKNGPQMVFTGPVFIGYPVDQAIQIMNQYRPPHNP